MYNLIVMGNQNAFADSPEQLESSRILNVHEYTAQSLVERYGDLSEDSRAHLQNIPCIFSHEAHHDIVARVGWITRLQVRRAGVRFSFEYDQNIPPIPKAKLLELEWELDFTDWEMNRTHWALKDVDLFEVLAEANIISNDLLAAPEANSRIDQFLNAPRAAIDIQPNVFRLPDGPLQNNLVAVMMPFDPGFDSVYTTIGQTCDELGLVCQRADEIFQENEIIQDIFSLIYRSAAIVCDFSGRNPNVYYEVGIAHTLGRPVIPITQNTEHVSFDVQHHRFLKYLNNAEGLAALRPKLEARIKTVLRL